MASIVTQPSGMPSTTASQLAPNTIGGNGHPIREAFEPAAEAIGGPAPWALNQAADIGTGVLNIPGDLYRQAGGVAEAFNALPGVRNVIRAVGGDPYAKTPTGLLDEYGPNRPETMAGQVTQSAGSMVVPLGVARAAKAAGVTSDALLRTIFGGTAGLQVVGSEYPQITRRMEAAGGTPEQAAGIARASVAPQAMFGALTSMGVAKLLPGMAPERLAGVLTKAGADPRATALVGAGVAGAGEGLQEGGQELLSMVMQYVAEDDPAAFADWQKRMAMSIIAGGTVGAGSHAISTVLENRQAVGSQQRQQADVPSSLSSLTLAELRSLDLQRGGTGKGTKAAVLKRLAAQGTSATYQTTTTQPQRQPAPEQSRPLSKNAGSGEPSTPSAAEGSTGSGSPQKLDPSPTSSQSAGSVREPWEMTRAEWQTRADNLGPEQDAGRKFVSDKISRGEVVPYSTDNTVSRVKAGALNREVEIFPIATERKAAKRAMADLELASTPEEREAAKRSLDDALRPALMRELSTPAESRVGLVSHKEAVQKAIAEGKIESHPDYPDLQPKAPDAEETPKAQVSAKVKTDEVASTTPLAPDVERAGSPPDGVEARAGVGVSSAMKRRGLKGDALANAMDRIGELRDNGAQVDDDGYVTLYHRTTPEKADAIRKSGMMRGEEDGLFFSTSKTGQADGFGDAIVVVREPVERVELDDVFGNEAHVRIPLKRAGQSVRVGVVSDQSTATEAKATPTPTSLADLRARFPAVTFTMSKGTLIPSTLKGQALADWKNTAAGMPRKEQIARLGTLLESTRSEPTLPAAQDGQKVPASYLESTVESSPDAPKTLPLRDDQDQPQSRTPSAPPSSGEGRPEQTSARKEWTAEDRSAMGLDTIDSPARRSWEEALGRGKDTIDEDKARSLVYEINNTPENQSARILNDIETGGLVVEAARLKNRHREKLAEVEGLSSDEQIAAAGVELTRLEEDFDAITRALRRSGTEKGRALAAQKLTIDSDLSLVSVKSRAKAKKGKPLTEAESKAFAEQTAQLEAANKKIAELEEAMSKQVADRAIGRARRHYAKLSPEQRARELADANAKAKALLDAGCKNA